jgi:stringent starvation protein B
VVHGFWLYTLYTVFVDARVEVPIEFVKNDEIVLNLSLEACHQLQMESDWISFQARFGGVPRKILVPVSHVLAIYVRENGQGMSFPHLIQLSRRSAYCGCC